ncbi:hypothetical protein A2982_00330 [candidate division WWE3 bacterium RIFCSPLOWO2_01_FULL_39_13]|uniref:DUF5671 domain-containing protein n=1 Tax=candidate division WWE3 bacterium RIFCSPLOWO2_01_FULL_39_13 TaxID=1802624 RepID=A0A1F4V4B2_UNCKA|nr:MAG: hypothetical protein A2982_00330 [candidate division WWE3 bacterium RIFCSPLOWO2_01_FULL_39_13]
MKKAKVIVLVAGIVIFLSIVEWWYFAYITDKIVNQGTTPPSLITLIGSSVAIWVGVLSYLLKKDD